MHDSPAPVAFWIASPHWQDDARPITAHPIAFRKDIELSAAATQAVLRITASWKYLLWVNGTLVTQGPARCFPQRQLYDEVDLAPHLRAGRNHLAVIVLPPTGVTGYTPMCRSGLFIDGEARCGHEAEIAIVSDQSWKARPADWVTWHSLQTSLPTGWQEHWDAQRQPADWMAQEPGEGWSPAMLLGPRMTPPWWTLEARPVPLLTEQPLEGRLAWRGRMTRQMPDAGRNLAVWFNEQPVQGRPLQGEPAAQAIELGEDNLVVLDLGRTCYLRPGVQILEVTGDVRLELYYGLDLGERPTAERGFGTRREGFVDTFRPSGGPCLWHTLQPRGFRYLTIRLADTSAAGTGRCALRPDIRAVEYPFPQAARFDSSDEMLRRIWQVSADTLRSGTNDAFVDTCTREDTCWTFDACVAGKAAFYTFGETRMWRRCLSLIGQGIDERGIPRTVVPAGYSFMSLFDQAMYWVMSCRDYAQLTGDISLLHEVAGPVGRFLGLCQSCLSDEDLFVPPAYSWHWVDWAPIPKRAYSLPVNLMLLLAAEAAATVATRIKHRELRGLASQLAERLYKVTPRFFDPAANCFANHLEPAGPVGPEATFGTGDGGGLAHGLHGNALALLARIGTPDQQAGAAVLLVRCLAEPLGPVNQFGPGWAELILGPLFEWGCEQEVLQFIKRVYGGLVERGEPTWPEAFAAGRGNTAHTWGAAINTVLAAYLARCPIADLRVEYELAHQQATQE